MPVYFIAENEVRINVQRRIMQLQTGSPYRLKLMGWIESDNDRVLEKQLHKKYASVNTHLEWFRLDASDGLPEYFGAWQWGDVEVDEFCPSCGWGGGMDWNENYGCAKCLNCWLVEANMY
jgi:hypothetical protein